MVARVGERIKHVERGFGFFAVRARNDLLTRAHRFLFSPRSRLRSRDVIHVVAHVIVLRRLLHFLVFHRHARYVINRCRRTVAERKVVVIRIDSSVAHLLVVLFRLWVGIYILRNVDFIECILQVTQERRTFVCSGSTAFPRVCE